MKNQITLHGRTFQTEVFATADQANEFLTQNAHYSVIGEDENGVHCALTSDNGSIQAETKAEKFLFGHTSLETAYEVKDYPYGFRLRTEIYYWIETAAKKGDRFCSCTRNPKNGRMNAPKKGNYYNVAAMYLNPENNHVEYTTIGIYSTPEAIQRFAENVGESNLLPEQMKQLRQLRGEKIVVLDEFTLAPKKDFSVKWEKVSHYEKFKKVETGEYSEVKITFDRPDGVSVKEIFEAIKTLNPEKLELVWNGWYSSNYKQQIPGMVRICVRGGMQLTTVKEEAFKEYQASDYAATQK